MLRPTSLLRAAVLAGLSALSGCMILRPTHVPPEPFTTPSGLTVWDLVRPEGEAAALGDVVEVHYRAGLETGVEFDSSFERGTPIRFTVGAGMVPAGFDEGVLGMVIGGRRRVLAPSELAFGAAGIPGKVPPDSAVLFQLELLAIE